MSRWQEPPSDPGEPARRTFWARSNEADPLGPGQLIRRAWRLYRSVPRPFLAVAAGPELLRAVLAIPSLIVTAGIVEGFMAAFGDYLADAAADPEGYQADPTLLQDEFQAQIQAILVPQPDLAAISAVTGAAGVVVGLIGASVLTAAALAAAAGRPISLGGVVRVVAARGSLVRPIIALAIGWLVVSGVPLLLQTSSEFRAWSGEPGSPRSMLLGSLLSVLGFVVLVLIVILAVRWALYIPVVIAESLGIGSGLDRAAQLSRGIRIRLALAMFGIQLLHSVSVGIVALVVGVTIGISAGSVAIGFIAYLGAALLGGLLWAPVMPAMLAVAYQTRAGETAAG